ncbi:predicted protein [Thalassiosira pseudonana CCMP1335]|uniref:BHLH domain-containing protein n=1 Tax=Thalassiosira pseudonana TaxID=35128 RepID=B8C437_THAPS|nr:predicted protein [Thalassiosira pseudonana CCMP1335]EED91265.1 predicted protein [Thalassiosira pseudonana CCMP1335]
MSNTFQGIKLESDDSSSLLDGGGSNTKSTTTNSLNGGGINRKDSMSDFDAAEAAVRGLGSLMDHRGAPSEHSYDDDRKSCDSPSSKRKKPLTNERREERNMREKERSLKITQQIHELRGLLSIGGVIVPKGTKSTILTEAANYIRLLQQHQYRSEIDKAQLVQEVQRIGNGAIGQKAAVAIRHVANQNGVSTMANFGEQPPLTTSGATPQSVGSGGSSSGGDIPDTIPDREYRCIFNSCSVGMAIATMGGSFIDCNAAFSQLSSYSKQELKAMTIFNITCREDLQGAFDKMSQLITPPAPGGLDDDGNSIDSGKSQPPVILSAAIKHRADLGLSVSLIRGEDGVAKYFNVTLVKMPDTPLGVGSARPVPATADDSPRQQNPNGLQQTGLEVPSQQLNKQQFQAMTGPQFTSG